MKKLNWRKKVLSVCLGAGILFSQGVYAQADVATLTLGSVLERIEKLLGEFKQKVEDYYGITIDGYQKPTIAQTPKIDDTKKLVKPLIDNYKVPNTDDYVSLLSAIQQGNNLQVGPAGDSDSTLTLGGIINLLTSVGAASNCPKGNDECVRRSHAEVVKQMAAMDISNIYDPQQHWITNQQFSQAAKGRPSNKLLDIDTLLAPLAYHDSSTNVGGSAGSSAQSPGESQAALAVSFIKFITGQTDPLKLLDALPQGDDPKSEQQRNDYVVKLRNYAALSSISFSNFSHMLARRIKNSSADPAKSQLELEHQLATRRLNSDWYDKMETASPAVVQREMLYLLAEINYQMYKGGLERERILATLSAMHIDQLQAFSRTTLEK